MGDYSIRIDGDTRRLLNRTKKLSEIDKKHVNLTLAEAIRTSTKNRFKTTKDPSGKKWEESTRAREENGVTLTETGRLKNSIKSIASESGFAVGTNTIYARTHQLGEKGRTVTIRAKTSKGLVFQVDGKWVRKKKVTVHIKIPARPFLGLDEDDMHEIKGTLEDVFKEE
jgi:phage virion morphogenesis protein